jgi:hypothetical protein
MAINFLNNVALNKNELRQARIENQPNNTAAGAGVLGQLFFDTTEDTLKQYVADDGSGNAGWAEVGTTSGVETFSNTNVGSTYVDFSVVNASAIGDVNIGFADLNAVDGTSTAADRFLTKNNKWATIPFGDITEVQGGTYISVTNQTGPVPIVNHDATTRTDTTSTVSANVFPVVDSVSTNSTGHVTAVNVKTVTVPDNNTTYDLLTAPTGTAIRLAGSDSSNDDVTISGTTGQTALTRISASELRVALTSNVTINNDLTVVGEIVQTSTGNENSFNSPLNMNNTKLLNVKTGTAATDGVNLGQVETLVAGLGSFQGGYDAATNTPALSGASNVAVGNGDFYVVTADGTLFTKDLEVGDMVFANTNIAVNSSPVEANYTYVIADANIAGAGATDAATEKGVSGFDSENFTVSTNGWVQLKPQSNPYAKKIALTGGVDSGGQTTFTVNIVTMFGVGALAANCIATVKETASNLIVYPEVTGNGTGSLDFKFIPVVSTSAGFYTAYVSYI